MPLAIAETKTLFAMSSTGSVEKVKQALARGGDPNAKLPEIGRTALHAATSKGHLEVVEVLLEHPGIDPNVDVSGNLGSALHLAAGPGHHKVVGLLLQHPEIVTDTTDRWGMTALHIAADQGHLEVVALLVQQPGADPNQATQGAKQGQTALHFAINLRSGRGHLDVVKFLLQQPGIDINLQDYQGDSALHKALGRLKTESAALLVKQPEININARSNTGDTALHLAAFMGKEEMLGLILDHSGVDVTATTNTGATALHEAVRGFGGSDVVRRLLANPNTDPNVRDNRGRTPIMSLLLESKHPLAQNGSLVTIFHI